MPHELRASASARMKPIPPPTVPLLVAQNEPVGNHQLVRRVACMQRFQHVVLKHMEFLAHTDAQRVGVGRPACPGFVGMRVPRKSLQSHPCHRPRRPRGCPGKGPAASPSQTTRADCSADEPHRTRRSMAPPNTRPLFPPNRSDRHVPDLRHRDAFHGVHRQHALQQVARCRGHMLRDQEDTLLDLLEERWQVVVVKRELPVTRAQL